MNKKDIFPSKKAFLSTGFADLSLCAICCINAKTLEQCVAIVIWWGGIYVVAMVTCIAINIILAISEKNLLEDGTQPRNEPTSKNENNKPVQNTVFLNKSHTHQH